MAWLDSGWKYRKKITLSRSSGEVTNYQMKLLVGESSGASCEDVDCHSKCMSTFNDLRFTKADGVTLLDYWIESLSGTTPNQLATVWIEFDSIGTSETTFYMYYGNSGATSGSNGDNTFLLFDDFNDGSIDTNKWNNLGSFTESNGSVSKYASNTSTNYLLKSVNTFSAPIALHTNTKVGSDWNNGYSWNNTLHFENGWETSGFYAGHYKDSSLDRWYLRKISGTIDSYSTGSIVSDQYYQYELRIADGSQKFYVDGTLKQALSVTPLPITTTNIILATSRTSVSSEYTTYFDFVFARNYQSVEPSWGTWGSEETKPKIYIPFRGINRFINYEI